MANNDALFNAALAGAVSGTQERWLSQIGDYSSVVSACTVFAGVIDNAIATIPGGPSLAQVEVLQGMCYAVSSGRLFQSTNPEDYLSISTAIAELFDQINGQLIPVPWPGSSAPGSDIYVDVNATGSTEDGSIGRPFHTLTAAIAAYPNGGTFLVAIGDYSSEDQIEILTAGEFRIKGPINLIPDLSATDPPIVIPTQNAPIINGFITATAQMVFQGVEFASSNEIDSPGVFATYCKNFAVSGACSALVSDCSIGNNGIVIDGTIQLENCVAPENATPFLTNGPLAIVINTVGITSVDVASGGTLYYDFNTGGLNGIPTAGGGTAVRLGSPLLPPPNGPVGLFGFSAQQQINAMLAAGEELGLWGNGTVLNNESAIPFASFAASTTGNTTATRFIGTVSDIPVSAVEYDCIVLAPCGGTLRNLVFTLGAPLAAGTITATVRIDGADTDISCIMGTTGTHIEDLLNTAPVTVGDRVSISLVCTVADASSSRPRLSLGITPG